MEHEGKFVKTKQEIKKAITDYYENVDNNKDTEALNFIEMFPLEPDSQPETQVIPDGKLEPLVNLQSVQKAIKKQKTEKAGGPDNTTAECFKHLPNHMIDKLKDIINAAITLGITPMAWQNNFVKLIYKKNEATKIENYRPISLLNTIFKIWENILYEKLKDQLNLKQVIHIAQFGSQKEKGATDAILAINLLQENNTSECLYTATIDLSKAYNRVDRTRLWHKLETLGVTHNLVSLLKSTYEGYSETYKIGADTTSPLKLKKGLRQGSVLSPILFILYVNDMLKEIQKNR
jgi:hypothetical protein